MNAASKIVAERRFMGDATRVRAADVAAGGELMVTGGETTETVACTPALASAVVSALGDDSEEVTAAAVGAVDDPPVRTVTVTSAVTTGGVALAFVAPPARATLFSVVGAVSAADTALAVDAEAPRPDTVTGTDRSSRRRRRPAAVGAPNVTFAVASTAPG